MIGFFGLTTEVSPGAGTKIAARALAGGVFLQQVEIVTDGDPIGPSNPVPVILVQYGSSNPLRNTAIALADSPQNAFDYTVPDGYRLQLKQSRVVSRYPSMYRILVEGEVRMTGRTGPANPTDSFTWAIDEYAQEGEHVILEITGAQGVPSGRMAEAYLQTLLQPVITP